MSFVWNRVSFLLTAATTEASTTSFSCMRSRTLHRESAGRAGEEVVGRVAGAQDDSDITGCLPIAQAGRGSQRELQLARQRSYDALQLPLLELEHVRPVRLSQHDATACG